MTDDGALTEEEWLQLDAEDILEKLHEEPANWRHIWSMADSDPAFDAIYENESRRNAVMEFLVKGRVIYFDKRNLRWDIEADPELWLTENAPPSCTNIANLYDYSKGIRSDKSPWLLFQYVTGMAQTTQGMGLNSLMGIGTGDAEVLAGALDEWAADREVVDQYVELLMMFGGSE